MVSRPRYAPADVRCPNCRQPPGIRCREVMRRIYEWWTPDGRPLAAPRVVELVLGRELREPHRERVRFARSESARVARRGARR